MTKPLFDVENLPVIEGPDPRGGPIKAWSYSSITEFEKCALRVKFGKIDRIETEKHPAAERGTQIHEAAEHWIKGSYGDELPTTLKKFEDDFDYLRAEYNAGRAIVEDPWAFTINWDITDWNSDDCWLRMALDAYVQEDATSAVVIDFKTGRKDGYSEGECFSMAAGKIIVG